MSRSTKTSQHGYFRNTVLAFTQPSCCFVELILTEEDTRCLASEFLNLVIKLRRTDQHVATHGSHIQILLRRTFLHPSV